MIKFNEQSTGNDIGIQEVLHHLALTTLSGSQAISRLDLREILIWTHYPVALRPIILPQPTQKILTDKSQGQQAATVKILAAHLGETIHSLVTQSILFFKIKTSVCSEVSFMRDSGLRNVFSILLSLVVFLLFFYMQWATCT